MSRFPELFEEAIEEVVIGEALLVEELAEHIARAHRRAPERRCAPRCGSSRATRSSATTPVTGLATQELVSLIGIAAASERRTRRLVGVEATGINACPCAQGLVRERAAERLGEAGFDELDVERILELVPLATHNQRGRGTLFVGTERAGERRAARADRRGLDELAGLRAAEAARRAVRRRARAPAAALRRGLGARSRCATTLDRVPGARRRRLPALAPGQPRDDPRRTTWSPSATARSASCAPSSRAASRPSGTPSSRVAQLLTGWLLLLSGPRGSGTRFSVPARRRPMFARWRTSTASAASAAKTITGQGSPSSRRDHRQRDRGGDRRERRVAEEREDDEPDAAPSRRRAARRRGTRRRRSRPSCRRVAKPQEQRPPVPEHRRGAGEHAGQVPDEQRRRRARARTPSATSSSITGSAEPRAVRPPDVRRADVAAADRADVLVPEAAARASTRTACCRPGSRRRGSDGSASLLRA